MPAFLRWVYREMVRTWRHPRRLAGLGDRAKVVNRWRALRAPGAWTTDPEQHLQTRRYRSYQQYLAHQRSKVPLILRTDHDRCFREALRERLARDACIPAGATTLCLGARSGAEVTAFVDHGCFGVGIDVNPTPGNPYVLHGDFQNIQWPDATVDAVYTNSLDHAFDIVRVLREIARILRPGGVLIIEAVRGTAEQHPPGPWESFYWATVDDLVRLLCHHDLELRIQYPFEVPWDGEHLVLRKSPASPGGHASRISETAEVKPADQGSSPQVETTGPFGKA